MTNDIIIRPPRKGDLKAWLSLWGDYCAFYGRELPLAVTKSTWGRLLDNNIPFMGAYVATDGKNGPIIGFATWVQHAATWSLGPRCYLEDLFVAPESRNQGVGQALIHAVVATARKDKCQKVYWMTKSDNAEARGLYDKMGEESGFVRYDVMLDTEAPSE